MKNIRSIPWIVFLRLSGMMLFLLILYMANLLASSIEDEVFHGVLSLLNSNIVVIVLMSLLFLFGEVFNALPFPLNLASPPFNAFAAVFLVSFLFSLFGFVDVLAGADISSVFKVFEPIVYVLVFFIVFFAGYVGIFTRMVSGRVKTATDSAGRWAEVAEEFRKAFSDFFKLLAEEFRFR